MSSTSSSQHVTVSSTRLLLSTFGLLATMVHVSLGQSWVMAQSMSLAISRIDPIVNPGGVAGHVHNIIGGSKFGKDILSPDEQRSGKCSTVNVQADHSNYWAPHLMYRYADNTYAPMIGSARIYYFNTNDDVVPFPPGLQMISGLASRRDSSAPQSFGLRISCNHGEQIQYLPNSTSAPNGCSIVSMGIFFPSCGTGALTSEDHFSHMTWPHHYKGSGNEWQWPTGAWCPDSHPIHYPTIFMEQNYWFHEGQPWRNEENLLVLSNGDTTGLTFHADFVNGWDQGVLAAAIKECHVGDAVETCGPFKPTANQQAGKDCRLEGEIPAEDVGLYKSLKKLPGCNPIWTANMGPDKPTCDQPMDEPGYVAPNAYYINEWQKMNIPVALPEATDDKLTDTYRPTVFQGLIPKVADGLGAFRQWGSDTGKGYVSVGTAKEALAAFVDNDGKRLEPVGSVIGAASSSSTTTSSAAATTTSKAATTTAAAPTTTASPAATTSTASSAAASASPSPSQGTTTGDKGFLDVDELGNPIGNVHVAPAGTVSATGAKAVAETPKAGIAQANAKYCKLKKRRVVRTQQSKVGAGTYRRDDVKEHLSRKRRARSFGN